MGFYSEEWEEQVCVETATNLTDQLIDAARRAREYAYAPYSGFRVGAALVGASGRVYVGANVENASFGLTLCAERAAVAAAVTDGVTRFERLVIATDSSPPAAPCGACRQVLSEFGVDLVIEAINAAEQRTWKLADLLPDSFGSEVNRVNPTPDSVSFEADHDA